ncbi:MAG: peptidoglycan D,D-transpeptidase FtsI family protein [Candidatus Bipolaricaulaceae bacterium]
MAFAFLGVGALAVVGRLIQLQALEHDRWAAAAQAIQEDVLELPAKRGTIYDRAGRPLACDIPAYSIALDNLHMTKPEVLVALLQEELGLSAAEAADRVYRESYFTWIARQVDMEQGERLQARADELGVRGLLFIDTWKRGYPRGRLAPGVLGAVGVDGQGLEGLELAYDDLLRGEPRRLHLLRGRDGRVYDLQVERPGAPGADLRLALDAQFQQICEDKLSQGVSVFRADRGFAVVMDPRNGAVLALAQAPRYDPADPDTGLLHAWAVTDAFEPGSTFKALIGLAAVDQGLVDPETTFSGDSPIVVGGVPIHNAEHKSYGLVTFTAAMALSVNTVLVQVAQRLGVERTHTYLSRMGFGKPTGIELPGEAAGILRPPEAWDPLVLATTSFGQGVSTSGIQLAAAFCALANGGQLLQPHLVAGPPEPVARVASAEACATLRHILRSAVGQPGATGKWADVPGFAMAGKSGTGEKAIPGQGYVAGHYIGAMAVFFPWEQPEYFILVVYDEVKHVPYWGGYTAGHTVKYIVQELAQRGLIAPYAAATTAPGRSG